MDDKNNDLRSLSNLILPSLGSFPRQFTLSGINDNISPNLVYSNMRSLSGISTDTLLPDSNSQNLSITNSNNSNVNNVYNNTNNDPIIQTDTNLFTPIQSIIEGNNTYQSTREYEKIQLIPEPPVDDRKIVLETAELCSVLVSLKDDQNHVNKKRRIIPPPNPNRDVILYNKDTQPLERASPIKQEPIPVKCTWCSKLHSPRYNKSGKIIKICEKCSKKKKKYIKKKKGDTSE